MTKRQLEEVQSELRALQQEQVARRALSSKAGQDGDAC